MNSITFRALIESNKVRYLISGGASFCVELGVFALLNTFHVGLLIASSVSFLVALVISFVLHRLWSFAGHHRHKQRKQFIAYVALALINLLLTNILIGLFVNVIKINPLIAKSFCIVIIALWNYIVMNRVIFQRIEERI